MEWRAEYADGTSYAGDYAGINREALVRFHIGGRIFEVGDRRLVFRHRRQRKLGSSETRELYLVALEPIIGFRLTESIVYLFEQGQPTVESVGYLTDVVELRAPELLPEEQ